MEMSPASPWILAGDNLDVLLGMFEYAIVIMYIGGIPLSHFGLKGNIYIFISLSPFLIQIMMMMIMIVIIMTVMMMMTTMTMTLMIIMMMM